MSSLPLTFIPTPQRPYLLSNSITTTTLLPKSFIFHSPSSNSFICYTFSSSSNNGANNSYEKEEALWLREEQRWLREEQRWLREEERWKAERDTLLHEIQTLQLKIQELDHQSSISVSEPVSNLAKLLQVLKDGDVGINMNQIGDSGSSAIPLVDTEIIEKEAIVKEVISVPDTPVKDEIKRILPGKGSEIKGSKRKTLRKGLEGDDVREMQEALQKLGFFSGEEDMEYSVFESGTESAVQTWQSAIGMKEDGIMTSELLQRLYTEVFGASNLPGDEIPQLIVKGADMGGEVSQNRVFLLGENRWEDPSRLSGRKKENSSMSDKNSSVTNCLTCRGEGQVLCMECDGTGEPNIEEQFMECLDEGAKCPYCLGHGYSVCDDCQRKKCS